MTIGIIIDLKIIQIHQCHTGRTGKIMHNFFIITAVISTGQRIEVQLGIVYLFHLQQSFQLLRFLLQLCFILF